MLGTRDLLSMENGGVIRAGRKNLRRGNVSPFVGKPAGLRVDSSGDDIGGDFSVDISQAKVPAIVLVGKLSMIDAEKVQNGCVQVVDLSLIHI